MAPEPIHGSKAGNTRQSLAQRALDRGPRAGNNGRIDGLGPWAQAGAVGKPTAIGAGDLYEVRPVGDYAGTAEGKKPLGGSRSTA